MMCSFLLMCALRAVLLQVTPHVQYALAVSSAVMTTNWVQLMRLLEGGPLLLAAAAQVRTWVTAVRGTCT
jgi:hypothetical protein